MSGEEQLRSIGGWALRTAVGIGLILMLAFCAITAPLWFRSNTVQYYVYPGPTMQQAGAEGLRNPGCEIYGKIVERDGQKAIRYRFPNDPDLERCFKNGVPNGVRIEKASWLETQADRPRPSWY